MAHLYLAGPGPAAINLNQTGTYLHGSIFGRWRIYLVMLTADVA
jgi:hypothetical protein